MVKRTILILVVCLIALSGVFADGLKRDVIKVSVIPSSFQVIKIGDDAYRSSDGFGLSAGYMKNVWKGLSAGGSLEWTSYKQDKLPGYGAFNNIALLAEGSYRLDLSEKVFAQAGLGLGYEMCIAGKGGVTNSFVSELSGNLGIGIDNRFSVVGGVKAKIAVQNGTNIYSVLPSVGADISL